VAQVLTDVSTDLASIVESSSPSVARVEGRRRMPASGVIWSEDGLIVTAHHVLEREEKLRVGFGDDESVSASLVGRDPTTDLALLRAEASGLVPAGWSEDDGVKVGHLVLALGRPRSSVQATLGIVSALGNSWRTPVGGRVSRFLQTDVVMYPGFSGGPLADASGNFLGLNTSALLRGISLTVPTQTVREVVETLLEHGRIRRGFLGVGAQPVELPEALAAEVDQETGLLLVSVEADSPAEKGGLSMGDTILAFDGELTNRLEALLAQLSGDRIGKEVTLKIARGGEVREVRIKIGERA